MLVSCIVYKYRVSNYRNISQHWKARRVYFSISRGRYNTFCISGYQTKFGSLNQQNPITHSTDYSTDKSTKFYSREHYYGTKSEVTKERVIYK